jgi:hypothetical protein
MLVTVRSAQQKKPRAIHKERRILGLKRPLSIFQYYTHIANLLNPPRTFHSRSVKKHPAGKGLWVPAPRSSGFVSGRNFSHGTGSLKGGGLLESA